MDCLKEGGPGRCHSLQEALDCHSSCYDAWADPRPFVIAVSLPGLGPLTGLPSSALTAEELKYSDIGNIGAMIAPWHFLEVKLGKRPPPVKSELEEEKERRKRRWEKNKVKVAAAQPDAGTRRGSGWSFCSGKRLELMNVELKTQMEELKQERQQLILMLSWHCPTCIVRTDSVKTTAQKAIHCWSSWRRSDHGQGGGRGGRGDGEKEEEEGPRELFLAA